MKMSALLRILLLPFGLLYKFWDTMKEGSRDLHNKIRFNNSNIDAGCCIDQNSKIAIHSRLMNKCIVNNSQIDSYTYIGNNCIIQNTTIGKFCSIANDVLIGLGKHPIDNFSTSPLFYRVNNPLKIKLVNSNSDFKEYLPVVIGNDVWIGARAIILDGVTVGHGAIIAANSVVTKDVPPYAIVGGIPTKIIKYRFTEKKIETLIGSNWWDQNITLIKHQISELKNFSNESN
jgi:acetyltransferase-like isoleucine patch superfamily enzyme